MSTFYKILRIGGLLAFMGFTVEAVAYLELKQYDHSAALCGLAILLFLLMERKNAND